MPNNRPISTVRKRKGVNACDNINYTITCTQNNKTKNRLKKTQSKYHTLYVQIKARVANN